MVLQLALGLKAPGVDHTLLRTRKAELIEAADIVWDVGGGFDVAGRRFNHHQRGAPVREDGTPFSSAGLICQVFGEAAVAALLPATTEGCAAKIAADNPAAEGPTAGDAAFGEAAAMVDGVLRWRVESLRARYAAESEILAAYARGADQRVLVLARGMPWKNVVFSPDLPVLFTISPASNGNWMVDTVPPEPGSFEQLLPLPERWAGLQNEALAAETGVADAVFVHLRRFVTAAKTLDGALALARLAFEEVAK